MDNIVGMIIEVEHYGDDGELKRSVYRDTMGYGVFLGDLIIYDQDGMDIATYSEYETLTTWDVIGEEEVGDAWDCPETE